MIQVEPMYPHPPQPHQPTNYFWILIACTGVMLIVLFAGLRSIAGRFSAAAVERQPITILAPAAAPRASISVAPQASASAPAPAASVEASLASSPSLDVDPKTLTDSPAAYRGRTVRVRGTVFYTGKLADGKTWIQIVGDNNVYVDGSMADTLPSGVSKGAQVEITGIGAGLTTVTASNGKDYDQAYIDPIQKIEIVQS